MEYLAFKQPLLQAILKLPLFSPFPVSKFVNSLSLCSISSQPSFPSASMAVTHADLAPSPKKTDLGSKTGLLIMIFSIILGLTCFILSLIAEATRSEVSWMASNDGENGKYECTYSGSGKTPLMNAAGAFLSLALAMVIEHSYLLIAVSKSPTASLAYWDPDSDFVKSLTWQAGFFFVATWISFAVGEILLLIGLSVESGHLSKWKSPRQSCVVIGQGVYSAAGVFGLLTVFMAAGLYISALRAQRFLQDQENIHRNAIEASVLYASPPRSPRRMIRPVADENPIARQDRNEHISLGQYMMELEKYLYLV